MRLDRRAVKTLTAALALATAGLAAGCGSGGDDKDFVHGKELFVAKCGACHVLDRAKTKGTQGPSLDAAFAAARGSGLGEDTVEGIVLRQMGNPRRGSIMPAGLYTGDDARDVAAYVALVAGRPGEDQGALAAAGAPKVSNKPILAKSGKLVINADPTGALAFASTKAESPAGAVAFEMDNASSVDHDIAVADESGKVIKKGATVGKGGKSTFTADLSAGTYEFLCTVPGHADGGMKGTLTVR